MALNRSFDLLQQRAGAHGAFVRFFDALAVIARVTEISVVFATISQHLKHFPLTLLSIPRVLLQLADYPAIIQGHELQGFLAGAEGVDDKIGA
jgi:hypothetical protein